MKKSIALFLLMLSLAGMAQRSEVGVFGGVSYYIGDLNPSLPFQLYHPAYGAVYRYNINTRLAIKANTWHGKVEGNDLVSQFRPDRGLNFTSTISEISGQLEFNYYNYFTGSTRSWITPYIFGGLGLFFFDPKAVYNGITYNLRVVPTEGLDYSLLGNQFPAVSMCFPFGTGIKVSISKVLGFSIEWGMRKTTTDFIDDVSTVYPTGVIGSLANPVSQNPVNPTGFYSQGMQRGNSKDRDWYSFAGAMLTVKLNYNKRASCDEPDKIRF